MTTTKNGVGAIPPGACGFFFTRHGETVANRDGVRSGGEVDTPLVERGREQMHEVARTMRDAGVRPGLIVASDLSRTRDSALILSATFDVDIRIVPELRERRLGDWNGRPVSETEPGLAAGETPPNGESRPEFRARILAALQSLAPCYASWPLIISSRGIARVLLERAGFRGEDLSFPNGGLLRVTLSDPESLEIAATDNLFAPAAAAHDFKSTVAG